MSTFTEEELAYMHEHIDDSRVPHIYWIYCSAIIIAVSSTTLRVLAKKYTRNGISVDDYLAALATICIIGESIINFITGTPYGLGRHIVAVKSQQDLHLILKGQFVFTQINTWSVIFVKLTILSFYYAVFPNPRFRRIVQGCFIFMILWHFTVVGVTIFGCLPIRKWWVPEQPGHCIKLFRFGIAANLIVMLSDFFIFLMPIPLLWKLKISAWRRIMLCCIFSLGLATCALTILRIIASFNTSADFTWDTVSTAAYYVFEPVGGLLCINIPFIARAIRRKMKAKKNRSRLDGSSPPDDRPEQEQKRIRRHSGWLRGIDSIQLTGMSSKRRSMTVGVDVKQRPWIPITPTSSHFDLIPSNAKGFDEVLVDKPEAPIYWDEALVGVGSENPNVQSNKFRILVEKGVTIERENHK